MRLLILTGFLTLWIFSLMAPAIITIVHKGEETVMIFWHNEEEQQESGKKDKLEEKIIPENSFKLVTAYFAKNTMPINKITPLNSSHIQEIHLPPPERNI